MKIQLKNIGKRFNRHWIFRGIEHQFSSGSITSIVGANGSGKSTLIKILSGFLTPTEGNVLFSHLNQEVKNEDLYKHVSYCAPYVNVPGELTLEELLHFHNGLKPLSCSADEFIEICQLGDHGKKQVTHFSSGMQQRVKLALALLSDVSLVFLDEPSSNLDLRGIQWLQKLMSSHTDGKTIIIGSNHNKHEIGDVPIAIDLGAGAIFE